MIILDTNYETIMSLCRKVQIVLQINSQSRQNYKTYGTKLDTKNIVAVEKIDIYCTNMFLLLHIIDTIIEVTNSLLCRHTQYYGCRPLRPTRCLVNELGERPRPSFAGDAHTVTHSLHWDSTRDDSVVSRGH